MQRHHDQVPGDEREQSAHREEVHQSRPVIAAEHDADRRELRRLVHHDSGQQRQRPEADRGRVGELLKRIVLTGRNRLRSEQEIVTGHRPHTCDVAPRERHRAVMTARDLRDHIQHPARGEDPHEGEVPLQRTAEPATDRGRWRHRLDQIVFGDFGSEARKCIEYPQAAQRQDREDDRIGPVAQANHPRMFVRRTHGRGSWHHLTALRTSCSPGRPSNCASPARRP